MRLWRSRAMERAWYRWAMGEGAGGTRGKRWTIVQALTMSAVAADEEEEEEEEEEEDARKREGWVRCESIRERMCRNRRDILKLLPRGI